MSKNHRHNSNNSQPDNEHTPMENTPAVREALVHVPPAPPKQAEVSMNKKSLPGVTSHPIQTELVAFAQALSVKTPVDGRWQFGLLELIRNTVNMADSAASERQWNAILSFFNKSKGSLMGESHILRPASNWPGSDIEFSLYRRMVYLICETADPATRRKAITSISLGKVTESLSEEARNRVVGFYA